MTVVMPEPDAATWRFSAACYGTDVDMWFPTASGGQPDPRALAICGWCQVRDECLTDAMAMEEGRPARLRHGVRGGMSALQRYRLATQTVH